MTSYNNNNNNHLPPATVHYRQLTTPLSSSSLYHPPETAANSGHHQFPSPPANTTMAVHYHNHQLQYPIYPQPQPTFTSPPPSTHCYYPTPPPIPPVNPTHYPTPPPISSLPPSLPHHFIPLSTTTTTTTTFAFLPANPQHPSKEVNKNGDPKTKLCWHFSGDGCYRGDACLFSHGVADLQITRRPPNYKTRICKSVSEGYPCPFGENCNYIHP